LMVMSAVCPPAVALRVTAYTMFIKLVSVEVTAKVGVNAPPLGTRAKVSPDGWTGATDAIANVIAHCAPLILKLAMSLLL